MFLLKLNSITSPVICNTVKYLLKKFTNYIQIQFGMRQSWGKRTTASAYLDQEPCERRKFVCSGAKACEYICDEIRNLNYYSVSDEVWQPILAQRDLCRATSDFPRMAAR